MYINFVYLESKGYEPQHLIDLLAINQKDLLYLERRSDCLSIYITQGLAIEVKGAKPLPERIRISKRGKDLLQAATTRGYTDDIGRLATALQTKYVDYGVDERRVGKTKKVIDLLVWFLDSTDFSMTEVYKGVEHYLSETDPEWVMNLENLLWKQTSVYSVHPTIKDSKLFEYLCGLYNRDIVTYVEPTTKAKNYIEWVSRVVNTKIPSSLPDDCYFTGSYRGDVQAKKRIKSITLDKL